MQLRSGADGQWRGGGQSSGQTANFPKLQRPKQGSARIDRFDHWPTSA